ncbi:MAG: prepilin-type N-terminal cleavage/methylation domain-containing protein [Nitrospinota bacterium]
MSDRIRGFTLIELVAVIAIIAIAAGLLLPRLPDVTSARLNSSSRKISSTIRYLYDIAHSQNKTLRLSINRDDNSYAISQLNNAGVFEQAEFPLVKDSKFPDTINVDSAYTQSQGEIRGSYAYIYFRPDGLADFAIIRLIDLSERKMSILLNPLTGKAKLVEGFFYVKS